MQLKKGIPVSPGIAVGQVFVLDTEEIRIPQRFIEKDNVDSEIARFDEATGLARKRLEREIVKVGEKVGVGGQILEIHRQLLSDPVLIGDIHVGIRENQYTAEYSVSRVINRYVKKFKKLESPMIQERIHDLIDVERLVLSTLLGSKLESLDTLEEPVVLVAHNLTPAQTASLDPKSILGFATDVGGKTSHTAIVARALKIPAVVAIDGISTTALGGDTLIIDGLRGVVILDPDPKTIEDYRQKAKDIERTARRLRKQTRLPSQSLDGYEIDVQANIELPQEVHAAVDLGASGIGLFRTEFIHLSAPRPDEELHFKQYRQVLKEVGDEQVVTLRTLDLGGDKSDPTYKHVEENPYLGCRSIRYCLAHPEIFRAQLRAIFRASVFGRVRLMLPMVGSLDEFEQALVFIEETKDELEREGVKIEGEIPIGVMVELPSLAVIADLIAPKVDFFSVGTNDLVQYTLAVDRGNEQVADLYDPAHPAVLRLLVDTLRAGREANIPVSICGEMAGETIFLPLLLGLGFRSLSVNPQTIPEVKSAIRSISIHDAIELARECLNLPDGREIESRLLGWQERVRVS